MKRLVRRVAVPLAFLLAIVVAGCGASASVTFGGSSLEHPEQSVSDALTRSVGERPAAVSCPDDIPVEDGHRFRCVVTEEGGTRFGATVTESNPHDEQVHLSVQVDQHPLR